MGAWSCQDGGLLGTVELPHASFQGEVGKRVEENLRSEAEEQDGSLQAGEP